MSTGPAQSRSDFFLSRRGSVAALAREVADVLAAKGYSVVVQDYDIPINADFVSAMHEGIKNARDLVVLFTGDYESSPHTRREFSAFEADRAHSPEERRVVILRCEDVALRGLFAPTVYQDLVGIDDPAERRERILAAVEGRSQGLKPPPRPFVGVPPRIASFTGRGGELERLDAVLTGGRAAAVTQARAPGRDLGRVAVQGMGGVGKTSLAVEYAYRYRDLYAGVWWCPAETRTGLTTALAALAVELDAASADEADIEKAARAGLRRLAEQRAQYLLIYDNVTSPEDVTDLLPASGARVLITSRFPDWADWAEEVALDVLPLAEAVACLEARAARTDPAGARALAEALGCLPLALDHAAATCRRTQTGFADFAGRAATMIAAAPRGAAYPRSVAATFDLAIATAVADCPAAGVLMTYLAACAPERIPVSLIEGVLADAAERAEALLALSDVALVRNDPFEDGTPAVIVHRLVQAVARNRAGPAFADAANHVINRLAELFPVGFDTFSGAWSVAEKLTPHLLASATNDAHLDVQAAALLDSAGSYFQARATFSEAHTLLNEAGVLFQRALTIRERELGPDDPVTATSLNNLAVLLVSKKEFARALPLHQRALEIYEKTYGPDHAYTSASLANTAHLLRDIGRGAEAEPLFRRAVDVSRKANGRGHTHTAVFINNFANLLRDLGRYEEAEPMFREAIEIGYEIRGGDDPITKRFETNYGFLLLATGRPAEALQLAQAALAIHAATSGPEHSWTLDDARLAADAFDVLGLRKEAAALRAQYGAGG